MNVSIRTPGATWIVEAEAEDPRVAVEWVWGQIAAGNVFHAQVSQRGGVAGGPYHRVQIHPEHVWHVSAAEPE